MFKLKSKEGFTLNELLVAVAIIGILTTIIIPVLREKSKKMKEDDVISSNMVIAVRPAIKDIEVLMGKEGESVEKIVDEFMASEEVSAANSPFYPEKELWVDGGDVATLRDCRDLGWRHKGQIIICYQKERRQIFLASINPSNSLVIKRSF